MPRRTIVAGGVCIPPDWHPEDDPAYRALWRDQMRHRAERDADTEAPQETDAHNDRAVIEPVVTSASRTP